MSAGTPDSLFYEGKSYAILRVNPYEGLFDPTEFGVKPEKLRALVDAARARIVDSRVNKSTPASAAGFASER